MNVSGLVTRYLERKAAAERKRRNDADRLHVSDVANGCTRATWWRIYHGLNGTFDGNTLKKMEYGHRYEAIVRDAIADAGYEIIEADVIDFDGILGHPDILCWNNKAKHLIEVKTTMLFRSGNQPPQHPSLADLLMKSRNYFLQASYYARAYGAESFTIHVSDRGTGQDMDYTLNTAAMYPEFKARQTEFEAALNSSQDEPEANLPPWTRNAKGQSYLCRSCPVATCRQNPMYNTPLQRLA